MSYVDENLLPSENVTHAARPHYIIFIPPGFLLAVCMFLTVVALGMKTEDPAARGAAVLRLLPLLLIALVGFMSATVQRLTTEMAATTRRVLLKPDGAS